MNEDVQLINTCTVINFSLLQAALGKRVLPENGWLSVPRSH